MPNGHDNPALWRACRTCPIAPWPFSFAYPYWSTRFVQAIIGELWSMKGVRVKCKLLYGYRSLQIRCNEQRTANLELFGPDDRRAANLNAVISAGLCWDDFSLRILLSKVTESN